MGNGDDLAITIPEAARLLGLKPITIKHWLRRYGLFRAEAPSPPAKWLFNRRQVLILAAVARLVSDCRLAAPNAIEALRDAPATELAESTAALWFRWHDGQRQAETGWDQDLGPFVVEVSFWDLQRELEERMKEARVLGARRDGHGRGRPRRRR